MISYGNLYSMSPPSASPQASIGNGHGYRSHVCLLATTSHAKTSMTTARSSCGHPCSACNGGSLNVTVRYPPYNAAGAALVVNRTAKVNTTGLMVFNLGQAWLEYQAGAQPTKVWVYAYSHAACAQPTEPQLLVGPWSWLCPFASRPCCHNPAMQVCFSLPQQGQPAGCSSFQTLCKVPLPQSSMAAGSNVRGHGLMRVQCTPIKSLRLLLLDASQGHIHIHQPAPPQMFRCLFNPRPACSPCS